MHGYYPKVESALASIIHGQRSFPAQDGLRIPMILLSSATLREASVIRAFRCVLLQRARRDGPSMSTFALETGFRLMRLARDGSGSMNVRSY